MSCTTAVPPPSDEVRALYERQSAKLGYVPNYARAFRHRPALMARWADLLAEVRRHVDPRRFELVTLAAALELRSSYCALAHGRALTAFLSEEEVAAIARGYGPSPLSAAEAAMTAFARKVAADAASVTSADLADLRAHGLTEAEIFDVAAVAAARAFFTKVLDATVTLPDAAYREMASPLREALTVGRPVAGSGRAA